VILSSFATLTRLIEEADRPALQALIRDRVRPALAELDWAAPGQGEDELTGQTARRPAEGRPAPWATTRPCRPTAGPRLFATGINDPNVQAAIIAILAHNRR